MKNLRQQKLLSVYKFLITLLIILNVSLFVAQWVQSLYLNDLVLSTVPNARENAEKLGSLLRILYTVIHRIGMKELVGLAFLGAFFGGQAEEKRTATGWMGIFLLTLTVPFALELRVGWQILQEYQLFWFLFVFGFLKISDFKWNPGFRTEVAILCVLLLLTAFYYYGCFQTGSGVLNSFTDLDFIAYARWNRIGKVLMALLWMIPLREVVAYKTMADRENRHWQVIGIAYAGITGVITLFARGSLTEFVPFLGYLNLIAAVYTWVLNRFCP